MTDKIYQEIYELLYLIAQKINNHTDTKTVRVDESFDHGSGTEYQHSYELWTCGQEIELAQYVELELKKVLPLTEYEDEYTSEVYWNLSAEYRVGL